MIENKLHFTSISFTQVLFTKIIWNLNVWKVCVNLDFSFQYVQLKHSFHRVHSVRICLHTHEEQIFCGLQELRVYCYQRKWCPHFSKWAISHWESIGFEFKSANKQQSLPSIKFYSVFNTCFMQSTPASPSCHWLSLINPYYHSSCPSQGLKPLIPSLLSYIVKNTHMGFVFLRA